ncbi:hypothetical protein AB6A40_008724 [Gnathostoma spinigerum]|uniref:Uncharacterized protein n=1 Tax=Gnathostoma spinigerum TaxID=75299 RepID=A0ABD6ER51_9BILA
MYFQLSSSMSVTYQIAIVILLGVVGEGQWTRRCLTPLSRARCRLTWMGHFKVRSIRKIPGDPNESRLYKLEVIEPVKGLVKGEVVVKQGPAVKHGGLSLRIGGEYVLSGVDDKFGQCSQMLRGQELNFKKMTEEEKQAFRNIDLDCPPPKPEKPEIEKPDEEKPVQPKLSDRDVLLKILEFFEKTGEEAFGLRMQHIAIA